MLNRQILQHVLSEYPKDYRTDEVCRFEHPQGLSGVEYWKVDAPAGLFFLRRWSSGQPTVNRLQFLQAVLWYCVFEGFDVVPLPCETVRHTGFVIAHDSIWELLPWMGGCKDSGESDLGIKNDWIEGEKTERTMSPSRVVSAMLSLAQFHEICSTFPLPNEPTGPSFAIRSSLETWKEWIGGRAGELIARIRAKERIERTPLERALIREAKTLIDHFLVLGGNGMMMFVRAGRLNVPIQPIIGNAHRRHLLFDREGVCGMLDFKEIGVDSVSVDVASLLGSIAGSDPNLWNDGLKAYRSIRPLGDEEFYLTTALDFAGMILSGLNWLELVFLKEYPFTEPQLAAILNRLRFQTDRLNHYRYGKANFVA